MTKEFILNLDDFVEEISLSVIDEILILESSIDDDIFKFDELVTYIRGVDITYGTVLKDSGIIRSEEVEIPLVEFIKIIIEAWRSKKIETKDGWNQIKDLIKRASEFTKYYGKELKIDLDILKDHITSKIIDGVNITDNFKTPELSKLFMFDKLMEGIDSVYESILDSLDLDIKEEEIPLLRIVDDIMDAYVKDRIDSEEAWNQIKDIVNKLK